MNHAGEEGLDDAASVGHRPSPVSSRHTPPAPPLALYDYLQVFDGPRPLASPGSTFNELDEQSNRATPGDDSCRKPQQTEALRQYYSRPKQQYADDSISAAQVKETEGGVTPLSSQQKLDSSLSADYDWQATRSQLLPSRNHGKKADWIRGWSEAVGEHGQATYCACSETTVSGTHGGGGVVVGAQGTHPSVTKVGGMRGILLKGTASTAHKPLPPAVPHEVTACRNCSRLPSPPPSVTTSAACARMEESESSSRHGRGLGKKMGNLLRRVRPGWKSSNQKNDGEKSRTQGIAEAKRQPVFPAPGNGHQRSSTAPVSSMPPRNLNGLSFTPNAASAHLGAAQGREALPWSLTQYDDTSNSDNPRDEALTKRMGRLQRAALLLQRSGRANE
ncbi:hypothetical protein B0H63DRAFT_37755 [Podospora didyma]|uniref:Uncharacterized protein n=1 Tax=Podospora didyma TaxID=330526 RepID=A0AAE0P6Y6_9PEZI|nr:hypothetical protein B0H63DRAFT_37755 [Podospora didyma]